MSIGAWSEGVDDPEEDGSNEAVDADEESADDADSSEIPLHAGGVDRPGGVGEGVDGSEDVGDVPPY